MRAAVGATQLLQCQKGQIFLVAIVGLVITAVTALLFIIVGQLVLLVEGVEHGQANAGQID